MSRAASGSLDAGWSAARGRMVERLIESGIRDPRVLDAFRQIPRHRFVPGELRSDSYRDLALPIGEGQTISAPSIVAMMTEALELRGEETVLEIGTGSGYQAAILSLLAARVISIERVEALVDAACARFAALGLTNVTVHTGDGTLGWKESAPYEAILVTAGGPEVPIPLLDQLAPGGRLVGPFGERHEQILLRVRRRADARLAREVLARCRFVDLIGAHGWAAA